MNITMAKLDKVIPYARNPRKNGKAISKVAASIKEFGFQQPIVVDKDYVVIAGHTRLEAARSLGLEEVPILVADKLTPQQVKAYRIADNKTRDYSEFDYELLVLELEELQQANYDLSLTAFEDKDLVKLLDFAGGRNNDPDEVPPLPIEPVAKIGDLYQLGKHRLLCGDATKEEDYKTLLQDELADMVWTDPPYNVNYSSRTMNMNALGQRDVQMVDDHIMNDNMDANSFYQFLYDTFSNIYIYLKTGSPFYICHASHSAIQFLTALRDNQLEVKQQLIWVKDHSMLSRQDYNWSHEPILYGWKPGAAHKWYGGFQTSTVIDDRPDLSKFTKEQLIQYIKDIPVTVFDIDRPHKNELHPTMKPIKLIQPMVVNSSQQGDIVLEPFAGSGSTLIACEGLNRRCYAMELDPKYIDVIIKRWEDYTGNKSIKVGQ